MGDPGVGRDVLLGLAFGSALALVGHVVNGLPTWLSFHGQTTIPQLAVGDNRLAPLAAVTGAALNSIVRAVYTLTILFLFRLFLPRSVSCWRCGCSDWEPLLGAIMMAAVATRLGLLALVAMWLARLLLMNLPAGPGLSTWYGAFSGLNLALLIGLATWSFLTSLGGRSPFGTVTLDA